MRLLQLNPSPKSRRLLVVPTGTACAAASALAQQLASGSPAWGSAALADVPPDGP